MASVLRLHPQQAADLKVLTEVDVAELQRIVAALIQITPRPLESKKLRDELRRLIPDREDVADALMRQALGLYALMTQLNLSLDDLFSGLRRGLESGDARWTPEEITAWAERESALRELVGSEVIRIVGKTLDLSYEYANVLQTARIITDVRPVFTPDAKSIDGAVISHKLFIRFDNVEGQKTFTMTLDEADVKRLRNQCERALLKTNTIAEQLSSGEPMRTTVPGRDDNG
jgi:hypothetical protein